MTKNEILHVIEKMPDNFTDKEIVYNLYLLVKQEMAEEDIRNNHVFTNAQIRELFNV